MQEWVWGAGGFRSASGAGCSGPPGGGSEAVAVEHSFKNFVSFFGTWPFLVYL